MLWTWNLKVVMESHLEEVLKILKMSYMEENQEDNQEEKQEEKHRRTRTWWDRT